MYDGQKKEQDAALTKQERALRQQQLLEKKRQARAQYNLSQKHIDLEREERREEHRQKKQERSKQLQQKKDQKKRRLFEQGYQAAVAFDEVEGVSASQWFLSICWLKIPIFGFCYALYLAISRKVHPAKRNFARGYLVYRCLVMMLALTILYVLYRVGLSFVDEILSLAS